MRIYNRRFDIASQLIIYSRMRTFNDAIVCSYEAI